MAYFKTCDHCGAHLDAGETCDCIEREFIEEEKWARLTKLNDNGQLILNITPQTRERMNA